jgi:hypothetical protein
MLDMKQKKPVDMVKFLSTVWDWKDDGSEAKSG